MNTSSNPTPDTRIVLVVPRKVLADLAGLILWQEHPDLFEQIREALTWMPRRGAEMSQDHVQIIPAAYIQEPGGKFCVLERVPSEYSYLDRKLSLVSGGHIDEPEPYMRGETFEKILGHNLLRELKEELEVSPKDAPEPLGIIYTPLAPDSSRHAAFIHRVQARKVSVQAPEEFNSQSQISGTFATPNGLAELKERFDPWSQVLIEHLTSRSS